MDVDVELALIVVIEQAGDFAALDEVFGHDGLGILGLDLHIERAFRQDLDDGPLFAEPETAGADQLRVVDQPGAFDLFFQTVDELRPLVRITGGPAAYQNVVFVSHVCPFF